jgi:hypothetical protein
MPEKTVNFQPSQTDIILTQSSIKIGNILLENVNNFTYLGSLLSSNTYFGAELSHRIQQATAAFGKLKSRVFQNGDIRLYTEIKVYKAIIVTTLLYCSETWTTYQRHISKLEKFQQHCLCKMMMIKWQDRKNKS